MGLVGQRGCAAVLLLLLIVLMGACDGGRDAFQLAEIAPPPTADGSLMTYLRPESDAGFAWRVYVTERDLVWAVATAHGTRVPLYEVTLRRLAANGEPLYTWSSTTGCSIEPGVHFSCRSQCLPQTPDSTTDQPRYLFRAVGHAFDSRVTQVVSITSEGEKFSAAPVNGFFFLEVSAKRPDVSWRSVTAQNRWGWTVHKYDVAGPTRPLCPT